MIDPSTLDTNTLALAQQLQDVRDGYIALKALTHSLMVVGGGLLGASRQLSHCIAFCQQRSGAADAARKEEHLKIKAEGEPV